ncbi:MAG: Nramp family divalent metal transporter [Bacteroidales bacterium]|nr:Nramp family divalent metal transporter [Bacteroidales bacterium]
MADSLENDHTIKSAPRGWAILLMIGPSIVWVSEYIGSGEVIIATRTGAILGSAVLWAVIIGIFLKFWIGMSGARYTVCTGEGMMDMFSRIPGPSNWAVWLIMITQFVAGLFAIGSVAAAGGAFLSQILPVSTTVGGWIIAFVAFLIAWTGEFKWMKITMSVLILITIVGVVYVAIKVFPPFSEFLHGLIPNKPAMPDWIIQDNITANPWSEILPLLGWGAGGFASQVWYSYWVMGAGYGAARKNKYGVRANLAKLSKLNVSDARNLKGWIMMVTTDSSFAMIIGILVTGGFLIAGAGVLGPQEIAPEGEDVATQLSGIFASQWGSVGGFLFLLGGTAALFSTSIGQQAGWPRLIADSLRICVPAFNRKFAWKTQFRIFLIIFFTGSMIIIYTFSYQPVALVKFAAIFEGLLLTPLQAVLILVALYFVMPRFFKPEVARILRPHWTIAAGLIVAFLFFSYFCIYQLPKIW